MDDITRNFTFTDIKQVRKENNVLITQTKITNYTLVAKDGFLQFVSADTTVSTTCVASSKKEAKNKKELSLTEGGSGGGDEYGREASRIGRLKMSFMEMKKDVEKLLKGGMFGCRRGGGYSSPVAVTPSQLSGRASDTGLGGRRYKD